MSLCSQAGTKIMFMDDHPLIQRLQVNFLYSNHLDHINNQTLASNSLSLNMVQLCFEKSPQVRQGHIFEKKRIEKLFNHDG